MSDISFAPFVLQQATAASDLQPAQALGFGVLWLPVLLAWLLLKVGFVGMAVWYAATFPYAHSRMLAVYQKPGQRPFWIGVVNAVIGLLVGLLLLQTGILAFFGALVLFCLGAFSIAGYSLAYASLGARIFPPTETAVQTRHIFWGGLAAEAAFLIPVFGWVLALGMLFRGLGAVVSALLAGRRLPVQAEEPVEPGASEE